MSQSGALLNGTGPSAVVQTLTPNVGGAVSPVLGNINVLGVNNITTSNGGAGIFDISVTGTTNHAVQIGNSTGSLSSIAVGTNGQVIIGATGADPAFANLTSTGGTIVFTVGANTLNLEVAGEGEHWSEITAASVQLVPNNGYIMNRGTLITATLPTEDDSAAAGIGATIVIMGKGAGLFLIAQNALQQINYGSSPTSAGIGGSIASTNQWDSITLRLIDAAGLIWSVSDSIGNLTVV